MALQFRKVFLAAERFESAGIFDVNGDGHPDIVSGGFWYEGPDFKQRHSIGPVASFGEYYDDFSTIPLDINGNGRLDFITGGWWGETLRWRENPGIPGQEWLEHVIAKCGNIETTRAWDIDGDGQLEIVPNTPNHPLVVYKLILDAEGRGTGQFQAYPLKIKGRANECQGHGLGFGDVNGDGRGDFILRDGWLEAPVDPYHEEWIWHPEFTLGEKPGVPILVVDLNNDGLSELIVGEGHGYGLSWWQQTISGDGKRTWKEQPIDPYSSQYHDLHWRDIDGDGRPELITGKRFRAHPEGDGGDKDPYGWYVFKWTGECFAKHVIDFGPLGAAKGLGIHFAIGDLTGHGALDVVAPGKDGLVVYFNEGTP
ncbi:FG-GAP-like repeat-containing protein [soil metagenome]